MEQFKGAFPEIAPVLRRYYGSNAGSSFRGVVRGHLPEKEFWVRVDQFAQKAALADQLREDLLQEIRREAELEVAPMGKAGGQDASFITTSFVDKVMSYALASHLDDDRKPNYQWREQSGHPVAVILILDGLEIAGGSQLEDFHRALIKRYRDDDRVVRAATQIRDLRSLREQTLASVDQCLDAREYVHYLCPNCPAAQAVRP